MFGCIYCVSAQVARFQTSQDSLFRYNNKSRDAPFLSLYPQRSGLMLPLPSIIRRKVDFDLNSKQYSIQDSIGNRLYRPPIYMDIDEYQRYQRKLLEQETWRELSKKFEERVQREGFIPSIEVNSPTFERIFGGNTIDLIPRGSADATIMTRFGRNENPLFNERQRSQMNVDFDQRFQVNFMGKIGDRLSINSNYNTEAQFNFENQIKLDYTGGEDDIVKKIEIGNVSMPLNTTLITGSTALFGVKTQLQFGKLSFTGLYSQQRSQSREIVINSGSQQHHFDLGADDYEENKHFFLGQYFRDNYNRALANAPFILSNVNITQVEVWVTNRSDRVENSRDVLAFLDLGENRPWNTNLTGGGSVYPAAGPIGDPLFAQQSNRLLNMLPAEARTGTSGIVQQFFQSSGGADNYARLVNARRLNASEFTVNERLGYISLNMPLNADQVLAVAYRYLVNGREYQVGEFSNDLPMDNNSPQVLYTKLLKHEVLKTELPIWDLMMKNIYSLGGYGINEANFSLQINRIDEGSGIEQPIMPEGQQTGNRLWIQLVGLDRLSPQQERQPDGVFDFLEGITIDPQAGRIMFPVLEPFGSDLRRLFLPSEQQLMERYPFQQLYDSTKVLAQQLAPEQNRYTIRGSYESQTGNTFQLGAINIAPGSVQVFSGQLPLREGTDFTVDYDIGTVVILNEGLLQSGQPMRIRMESNELFGLQQRTLFGARLNYHLNDHLDIGGTFMSLRERPLTQKVNAGYEPLANKMYGFDLNYHKTSPWLTHLLNNIPLLHTEGESSISFYGEFAKLDPGHASALNIGGDRNGVSYIDDFENSKSIIDLKTAQSWHLSGTPIRFPEAQLLNDLRYGYNRAQLAYYNIDPLFYRNNQQTPSNIQGNVQELSNHYVREVLEHEVFPYRQPISGQALYLPTLDLAYYPRERGPYNYTLSGLHTDGTFVNPKDRWAGIFRQIQTPDFEAQNIEFIEFWMMDPFIYHENSEGGDLYVNLGNISEDILKDGRRAVENALPADGNYADMDTTSWGRVPKLQPMVQAFDNEIAIRDQQDVGLDLLSDEDERSHFGNFLNRTTALLTSEAAAKLQNDPSSDNFRYFQGSELDQQNRGILDRYKYFNGPDGNSPTQEQARQEAGRASNASTLLPDGEDVNHDNTMNERDEYYEYKFSVRPADFMIGKNHIVDIVESPVTLRNGQRQTVKWYQVRIPVNEFNSRVGDVTDFKSIRFMRMFLTGFADTTVLRFARLQLVRGEWRRFNAEASRAKMIVDPAISSPPADQSTLEVATVNIEENGNRHPIPYVVPPGIERQLDYTNFNSNVELNEQALSLTILGLQDGYGRGAYRMAPNDFRAYRSLQLFIHAEGDNLRDGDVNGFIRVGTDGTDHYYEYEIPLQVTPPGVADPEMIWPEANRMNISLALFQEAKLMRNRAVLPDGSAWPVDRPFTYSHGAATITIKGQPDLSKVRFYMLGAKNPLRAHSPHVDDGANKNVIIWFNELRLTDFDNRGGWAATTRLNAQLADFGDVNVSGTKSTIGFGPLETGVAARSRSDDLFFDMASNLELGKFLPLNSGVRIPFHFNLAKHIGTPEYDPLMPDIKLQTSLNGLNASKRDSLLRFVRQYQVQRGFSFTNIRKERLDTDKPLRLWDIENFTLSYAFSTFHNRDYLTESATQKNYRGSLAYEYIQHNEHVIEPFKKLFKEGKFKLLADLHVNLLPSLINFRVDVDRLYSENTLRIGNSPDNFLQGQQTNTFYNKNFTMSRFYGISWNLSHSLKLDINATNYAIIDEPAGRVDGLARDTLWHNFWNLGRTTDYNHMLNLTYTLPFNKIRAMDWVTLTTRYGGQFIWQTQPLFLLRDPALHVGNTIQNSRTIQLNPRFNFLTLLNKFSWFRGRQNDNLSLLTRGLSMFRDLNAAYTRVEGTFLPGYLGQTDLMGHDFSLGAPGIGFILGSQQDIRFKAMQNGWISTDSLQTQLYARTLREDLSLRAVFQLFRDMRMELTATRIRNQQFNAQIIYSEDRKVYESLAPFVSGDYSISYFSLPSSFKRNLSLFKRFQENRPMISTRLGQQNANSQGINGAYADGYDADAQEVLVGSFLATYSNRDPNRQSLDAFPKIPIPNWRLNYTGLHRLPLFEEIFASCELNHSYRSSYTIQNYNTLIRYDESNGSSVVRDQNGNFLPQFQFSQIIIAEQFSPLIGMNARFKNNVTANAEFRRARSLNLSILNSQLVQLMDQGLVMGIGYRVKGFKFPFGLFLNRKMNNDFNFKLDVALNDMQTWVFRSDTDFSEISSGNRNVSYRPSVDYFLNDRVNIRMFFDSNVIRPYTSQSFATAFTNFGFNLRFLFQ